MTPYTLYEIYETRDGVMNHQSKCADSPAVRKYIMYNLPFEHFKFIVSQVVRNKIKCEIQLCCHFYLWRINSYIIIPVVFSCVYWRCKKVYTSLLYIYLLFRFFRFYIFMVKVTSLTLYWSFVPGRSLRFFRTHVILL